MDMDQRTRMLGRGSNGGRIILLGDGTEYLTGSDAANDDDGDIDMEDRADEGESEEEEKDLQEQVKKGQSDAKAHQREETPGPAAGKENEPKETVKEAEPNSTEQEKGVKGLSSTPDEPKMTAPVDTMDTKKVMEEQAADPVQ